MTTPARAERTPCATSSSTSVPTPRRWSATGRRGTSPPTSSCASGVPTPASASSSAASCRLQREGAGSPRSERPWTRARRAGAHRAAAVEPHALRTDRPPCQHGRVLRPPRGRASRAAGLDGAPARRRAGGGAGRHRSGAAAGMLARKVAPLGLVVAADGHEPAGCARARRRSRSAARSASACSTCTAAKTSPRSRSTDLTTPSPGPGAAGL